MLVHLHTATKDKIWWVEFVDVFLLLFREMEPKLWTAGIPFLSEYESYQHPKVKRNWNNWPSLSTSILFIGAIHHT